MLKYHCLSMFDWNAENLLIDDGSYQFGCKKAVSENPKLYQVYK